MRKLSISCAARIGITAISFFVLLVSCQKEYTAEISHENTETTGSFKAKINSVQWTADKGAGAVFSSAGNGLPRLINISGLSNDKKYITMTLVDSGVHKYTFGDGVMQAGAYVDSALANTYAFTTVEVDADIAGTAEITSINTIAKTISGTFAFKAFKEMDNTEVNITEGSFTDIPYIDGAILPPASSADTFHVKINDTLFKAYSVIGMPLSFNHTIRIQGSDSAALKSVGLTLPDNITAGTYDITITDYPVIYLSGTSSYGSVSGKLKILEHNVAAKRIRGTFDLKAEDPIDAAKSANLTEGYFSVKYQ